MGLNGESDQGGSSEIADKFTVKIPQGCGTEQRKAIDLCEDHILPLEGGS